MRKPNDQMNIWLKVTNDKYELPVAVADSAEELAKLCGVKVNNIHSSRSHAKARGQQTWYRLVKVDDKEREED